MSSDDVAERMANGVPAVTSKQESTGLTGKSRTVGGRATRLAGASLGHKDTSSGLPSRSSVAATGKPDAVKVARPVWSGGKTARSYLSLLATRSYGWTCYDWDYNQDVTRCATTGPYQDVRPG